MNIAFLKKIAKFLVIREYRVQKMVYYSTENCKYAIIRRILKARIENKYQIEIRETTQIGRNVRFPHPHNIVLGGHVIVGNECTIYHDVTVGQNRDKYPLIEDGVIIYPGAKIFGDVVIGKNSVIGANTVVNKSIPQGAIVAGIPAHIISFRGENDEFN